MWRTENTGESVGYPGLCHNMPGLGNDGHGRDLKEEAVQSQCGPSAVNCVVSHAVASEVNRCCWDEEHMVRTMLICLRGS